MTYKFFIATKVVLSDNLLTISGGQLYNTYVKAMIYHGLNSEWADEIREYIKELL